MADKSEQFRTNIQKAMDTNKDGKIDVKEVKEHYKDAYVRAGELKGQVTEERLTRKYDVNDDNKLGPVEKQFITQDLNILNETIDSMADKTRSGNSDGITTKDERATFLMNHPELNKIKTAMESFAKANDIAFESHDADYQNKTPSAANGKGAPTVSKGKE